MCLCACFCHCAHVRVCVCSGEMCVLPVNHLLPVLGLGQFWRWGVRGAGDVLHAVVYFPVLQARGTESGYRGLGFRLHVAHWGFFFISVEETAACCSMHNGYTYEKALSSLFPPLLIQTCFRSEGRSPKALGPLEIR